MVALGSADNVSKLLQDAKFKVEIQENHELLFELFNLEGEKSVFPRNIQKRVNRVSYQN